jgi:hypothetical protein
MTNPGREDCSSSRRRRYRPLRARLTIRVRRPCPQAGCPPRAPRRHLLVHKSCPAVDNLWTSDAGNLRAGRRIRRFETSSVARGRERHEVGQRGRPGVGGRNLHPDRVACSQRLARAAVDMVAPTTDACRQVRQALGVIRRCQPEREGGRTAVEAAVGPGQVPPRPTRRVPRARASRRFASARTRMLGTGASTLTARSLVLGAFL